MAAEKTFNQKLMEAMKEMENPKKEKTAKVPTKSGKEYTYNYETLDQVLGVVRPALANNGLMLVQGVKWNDNVNSFVIETGAMDEKEERILDVRPFHICENAQDEGSWETYTRRYALRTAFGLTGEDDDGAATLKGNQNGGSYAKSSGSNDAFKGAKETGLLSEKQEKMIHAKLKSLAELRGVTKEEATQSLLEKVKAESIDKMTKSQASESITILFTWEDKAKDEAALQSELYEEDVNF